MIPVLKTTSPQARAVYKLLDDGQELNAQQIADKLDVVPNSVYRLTKKLVDIGVVEEVASYPTRYRAVPLQTALSFYLLAASYNFRREFGLDRVRAIKVGNSPAIGLIKDRPSLLARATQDVRTTHESIDIIVSGHELPDDLYLAHRKAVIQGARIRRIVHQKDRRYTQENKLWKELGAEVRYLPDFSLRMLIYDKRIVYIASFDPDNPKGAFGVRFEYEPLAMQMTELFEQNWLQASEV